MAVSWRTTAFQKKGLKPLFLQCFLGARFLGQGVLITEKIFFGLEKGIFVYFQSFSFFLP